VYSAPRLSSVAAWGRLLPLDAAALSTPPTCSREVVGDQTLRPNHPTTQLWHLAWTAQRHQGGARRAEDSRGADHAKCQSEHRKELKPDPRTVEHKQHPIQAQDERNVLKENNIGSWANKRSLCTLPRAVLGNASNTSHWRGSL
jgi:hypothetical protein